MGNKYGSTYYIFAFLSALLYFYFQYKIFSQWPTQKRTMTMMMPNHDTSVMKCGTNSRAIKRDFVTTSNRQIFVLGAAGIYSPEDNIQAFNKFNVYGQRYHSNSTLHCCLKFADGVVLQHPIEKSHRYYTTNTVPLPLFNVVCANPRSLQKDEETKALPIGITIVYDEYTCNSSDVGFVEPFFPKRQPNNSFAITPKISHGHLSHDLLISWIEAYLWLGADKIVTYALSNLSADARRVLEYYAAKNVLDVYDYRIPELDAVPRDLITQWRQTWTDASLTMFDACARNSGYTYFSTIDWDEFILPSGNRTLKQLLLELFLQHHDAAGVSFQTQYFLSSAPPEDNDVFIKKFTHRLNQVPTFDRKKIIYKPALARQSGSHSIAAIRGYKTLGCPVSEAFIRHYRKCLPNDSRAKSCSDAADLDLVRDTSVSQWADNIVNNVRKATKDIFASDRG